MNEWLAQVYGTGQSEDIEKTAQSMMLNKLAEEEGIDLSGLSEEELDALAQAVAAEGQEGQYQDDGQYAQGTEVDGYQAEPHMMEQGDVGEEALQAKFAEADFLGRVMAHAYTQELQKIAEEEAAAPAKCEGCDEAKGNCKCPPAEKTASGPIARAIERLGGTVEDDSVEAYVEKLAEARAEELAVGWLQANGYLK